MKKSYFIHAIWLVVAIGAYAIGHFSTIKQTVSADGTQSESTRLLLSASENNAGSNTSRRTTSSEVPVSQIADLFNIKSGPLKDHEIEAAAKEAFSDPNPLKRQLAFARLLESLTPENAEAIRDQMREGRAGGDQWRLFQYAWGAIDPTGAMAAAEAIEDEGRRNGAVGMALSGWASADPASAIDWLSKMEPGDNKTRMESELINGLADNNINTATNYVLELMNAGNTRASQYMETVASEQLRKGGHLSAALWAEQLPDGAVKGAAMDRVASVYVSRDPQAAAAWAQQFATADYASRVIEEVGDEWAERDPVASVNWLESLADGKGKSEGMYSALGEWVRRDPEAASQYLVDMPASEMKDSAVSGFVRRLAWDDPQSAVAWADTISQENVRVETLKRAGQAWVTRDRNAAVEWLKTSGLPEATQKEIMNPPRDRRRRG